MGHAGSAAHLSRRLKESSPSCKHPPGDWRRVCGGRMVEDEGLHVLEDLSGTNCSSDIGSRDTAAAR